MSPSPASCCTACQNAVPPPTSAQLSMPTTAILAPSRAALVAWMRVLKAVPNWMKPNSRTTSRGRSSANSTAAAPSSPLPHITSWTGRRRAHIGFWAAGNTGPDVAIGFLDRVEERVEASNQQQRDGGDHERVLDRGHPFLARSQLAEAGPHVGEHCRDVRQHGTGPPLGFPTGQCFSSQTVGSH